MRTKPKCFVAMPMSDVNGVATEAEWNRVYQKVFAPAIRAAGFDPIRSNPVRGSLVAGIIHNLWSAEAMIADLTGQKPNVFYELGVRHALRGKTVMIVRNPKDIPFDLKDYPRCIYNPKTVQGQKRFRNSIRKLLRNIIQEPDRPDNPVEDFVQNSKRVHGPMRVSHLNLPQQAAYAKQLTHCERVITDIGRGQVQIPATTAGYFNYFINLINTGTGCEPVRVFLSKMDDNSTRYDREASKQMFAPFVHAVQRRKMRIEYTCLFDSKQHYAAVKGGLLLDRHKKFAYSVRWVFQEDMYAQPINIGESFVLLQKRKWAITHTWDRHGIFKNPKLLVDRDEFDLLQERYDAIRRYSGAYHGHP